MTSHDDDVPLLTAAEPTHLDHAAQFLEKAAQSGCPGSETLYLLALAHKRQGRLPEARAALRKITKPDGNVFLQLGLLSLREGQLAQAEQELARAWQMAPSSYAIGFNLLLTRLTLGQTQPCLELMPAVRALTREGRQARALDVLEEMLKHHRPEKVGEERGLIALGLDSVMEAMTPEEEHSLIRLLRGLGNLEVSHGLLRTLGLLRPRSPAVLEAQLESTLARGRDLIQRSRWTEAVWLLEPYARERASRHHQALLHNLLGCCAFVTEDFAKAVHHFEQAVRNVGTDARLRQNYALALEKSGELTEAGEQWDRFLELLGRGKLQTPTEVPDYVPSLEFESLLHLANVFGAREKWPVVLNYLTRANRLRPDDSDVLERLFHTYNAARQQNNARKILNRLRDLRPNDPQLDLYEIDMVEVKNLTDIERMLTEIERVMQRYPDDHRVEERAVSMVGNVIPLMGNLCDQLTDQLNKVMNQIGNLPRYQVDWSALREIMRDLMKEFQKLRRITGKCLPLVSSEEHRRIVRDLTAHIDQKIEACRSVGA